ncbi:DUF1631 domain-containing protein [Aquincola sp. J276]|uniref:DUF1631 domain-containing protein n=1 Tax=Aquincola sp. J276 TaxID=2898432 RepID=UPI002151F751|nr:DUF1631 domain-containing protein [Aquincola sp. J276]MCR5866761.1 DUF1631 domain-containing protein [Aquincola sp. J276]
MNSPLPRPDAALQAAALRIKHAAREAAQRCVDSLGLAALSSLKIHERDDFLAAQFELNRRQAAFVHAFNESLDQQVQRETAPRHAAPRSSTNTPWEALSLVDDHEVEASINADRFGLVIQHACEWELRELDAYVGSLLQLGRPDHERNPLRPELVGKALLAGVEAISERPEVRKLLGIELGRSLADLMPRVYGDIVSAMRDAGVQPVSLAVRSTQGPGNDMGFNTSGYDGGASRGAPLAETPAPAGAAMGGRPAAPAQRPGTPFGHVDVQLMSLIRQLASSGGGGGGGGLPLHEEAAARRGGHASGFASSGSGPAPNLIYAHRDELRQASTGRLDHMVIDVVGSLFEQILSDPKVPPQMARQIARLQLPVLRVALGDPSFFSSRRHPVRRFVNRIASLACAFDDLAGGPGQEFLGLVRALVQEIVDGDFDQMEVYEQKLGALEAFIASQARQEVQDQGSNAPQLVEAKEQDLRVQQQYMRQLQTALAVVEMPAFLRDFLAQVWSQALVQAARRGGEAGELAQRLKRAARDVVMSVQPKGTPGDRKNFLMTLPQLMKDLNHGLAMIGWPEPAKKSFFSELLPAHAESLKGQSLRPLDYNLMVKQLDAVFAMPLPRLAAGSTLPVLNDAVDQVHFSEDEAAQIGLVQEHAVNWQRSVDIDLNVEPEISAVDIRLDGLPPPEPVEPSRGASLADHVQLGFAYQMLVDEQWQKVKLNYVSPGRAFFVFTSGGKHHKTVSLTSRMLHRLCEAGRFRAFENAFLIERATARARKQLAALRPAPTLRH